MPLTAAPDISVIVPVMNEQGNIKPLIDEIVAVYEGRSFEIIYVNDGSDDGTADELKRAVAYVKQLRVLTHERRTGQSAALRTALYQARAPLIAVLDGDGQNIPSDLPALEAALLDNRPLQGMAAGVRVARKDTGMRRYASAFARSVRRALLGDDHPDSGCGIKIVDRDLFMRLPFFNHMHRFMPTLIRGEGGMVVAVPVGHRARVAGQSKYGIVDRLLVGVADLVGVIWLMRRRADPGYVTEQEQAPLQKSKSKVRGGKKTKTKAAAAVRQKSSQKD
jgi:dolichol-phosphate mannosyltransferase